MYKVPELEYTVKKANIKVLFMPGASSPQQTVNTYQEIITDSKLITSLTSVSAKVRVLECMTQSTRQLCLKQESNLEHIVYIDDKSSAERIGNSIRLHSLEELARNQSTDDVPSVADPSDAAIIMFTSVSTTFCATVADTSLYL